MPYIAIEGCIASGKTTLAKALAQELGIQPTLEDYHDVPSLHQFYEDPEKHAFETEIQFTQAHFGQLASVLIPGEDSILVTDFTLKRDLLFATITLENQPGNLKEYKQFWHSLATQLAEPDLILLLEAPVDELLLRIKLRGRSFEQRINADYLERLVDGLRETYRDAPEGSVQIMNSRDRSDLVKVAISHVHTWLGPSQPAIS